MYLYVGICNMQKALMKALLACVGLVLAALFSTWICSFFFGWFLQDVMQQATNAILRGGTIQAPTVSAKTIAEQLAEKINAKLNYVPIEKQEEEKQDGGQNESFKRYEEELEINDFPQASKHFANEHYLISTAWAVMTPVTHFVSVSYSS